MNTQQIIGLPVETDDSGYRSVWSGLKRRQVWVLSSFVSAIGIAALMTALQPAFYQSEMQLLVEPNYRSRSDRSNSEEQFADTNVEVDTATQINVMQSSELLKRAMTLLQPTYPDIDPKSPLSISSFKGSISIIQVTAKSNKDSKKTAANETKIFQVSYMGDDPRKTKTVLKTLKKVFLEYNLEQQRLRLERGLSFINEQLPQIQNKVKQSETALELFRRKQDLVDPEAQAKAQIDSLSRIQDEQRTNLAQIRELNSKYVGLQRRIEMDPQQALLAARLTQSNRYQSLLSEIQKTDLAVEQQRLRFKDTAPFVQQLVEQRNRQMNLLRTEASRVLNRPIPTNQNIALSKGQMGATDLNVVGQLIDAQINLQGTQARYITLANAERQIRTEVKRLPQVLAEYERLRPEVELNRDTLKELLKARQQLGLEIARGGFGWQVLEEPQFGYKIGAGLLRNLVLGGIVGIVLGSALAYARETMDDAIHTSEDLKKQAAVPLLGLITEVPSVDSSEQKLPVSPVLETASTVTDILQWKPFRESLDLLYQNIQLLSRGTVLKSLVITSALAGEGKSTLVLGLAISAARLHQRVLLIDGDLRNPSLHKLLNLPNDKGLSTLLASETEMSSPLLPELKSQHHNIAVLTAGPQPADPAKLLSSPRLQQVITAFEQSYDLVLVDAPPTLGIVDTILEGQCCDGVLLVGEMNRVTRSQLTQVTDALEPLNLVGIVANRADQTLAEEVSIRVPKSVA